MQLCKARKTVCLFFFFCQGAGILNAKWDRRLHGGLWTAASLFRRRPGLGEGKENSKEQLRHSCQGLALHRTEASRRARSHQILLIPLIIKIWKSPSSLQPSNLARRFKNGLLECVQLKAGSRRAGMVSISDGYLFFRRVSKVRARTRNGTCALPAPIMRCAWAPAPCPSFMHA